MKPEDLKEVKISNDYTVKIFFVKRVDVYDSWGSFNPTTREVKIKKSLGFDNKMKVLDHEITHAKDHVYGIKLSEKQTLKLEEANHKVFKLNPDLKALMIAL